MKMTKKKTSVDPAPVPTDPMTSAVLEARTKHFFSKVTPHEVLEVRTSISGAFTEFVVGSLDGLIDKYRVYGSTEDDLVIL